MEASPNPTRQRNRRSERYEEAAAPMAPAPLPQSPEQPTGVPLPRALQKDAPVRQPVQPAMQSVPLPRALQASQNRPAPQQHMNSVPAPRVLQQAGDMPVRPTRTSSTDPQQANSQRREPLQRPYTPVQATAQPVPQETPRPRRPQQRMMDEPAPVQAAPATEPTQKMPGWMIGSLAGMFLLVMAMITAISLMQAYLKTQADAREAAYQAMLDNYHVLAGNDVTMSVTYQDAIEFYAAENNLQPAFVTAIIRNESSFRRDAESDVGARGLMQLMPDTSEWIAGKLDVENFSFDMMYDAETNIRFGCWYLGYLAKLFRGDPVLVTAAYHAGQTTVTRWLSDRSMSPDGRTIPLHNLMDGPTKTYAGRVTLAYGIYQALLYPEQPLHSEVSAVSDDGADSLFTVIER